MKDEDRGRPDERAIRKLMGTLRTEVRATPELRANVMLAVRATTPSPWRRALEWFFQPRTIRLSPAMGGLAVAALAALLVPIVRGLPAGGTAGPSDDVITRFVFVAPEASAVQVTGDFVDWSPEGISLHNERGTGIWTVDVPLEPGVYQYAFVVDGSEWRPDPSAVSNVDDGFGRENSVVIVSGEGET
jgi:hypothetical protein